MFATATAMRSTFSLAVRAIVVTLFLSAPVLAVPAFGNSAGNVIEAPAPAKSGLGFVLLVTLQRAG